MSDIYIDMPQKILGEFIMVSKERWEKVKALPEKWRKEYYQGDDCADELEEALK